MPIKTSPQTRLTLILSSILGGMIGVFYVLIANYIRDRKSNWLNYKKSFDHSFTKAFITYYVREVYFVLAN